MRYETKFRRLWNKGIKPIATKCSEGMELVKQWETTDSVEEKEVIRKELMKYGRVDWLAAQHIDEMVHDVERYLESGGTFPPSMSVVLTCLNSGDYYRDVFKGKECEESKNYRMLVEKLKEATELLSV